ncbi:hypothetical protein [Ammoniphilus sp. 3BR4]
MMRTVHIKGSGLSYVISCRFALLACTVIMAGFVFFSVADGEAIIAYRV